MKKKCGNCHYFEKTSIGSPGRNHGKCKYFIGMRLPDWAKGKNTTIENRGNDCETYEKRK
jgi:hypothetical protein